MAKRARARMNDPQQIPTSMNPTELDGSTIDPMPDNRSVSMGSEPSEEDIRLRAYHRYLARGGSHGMDFDDWVNAESELKGKQ
jgi:hypothetical protein